MSRSKDGQARNLSPRYSGRSLAHQFAHQIMDSVPIDHVSRLYAEKQCMVPAESNSHGITSHENRTGFRSNHYSYIIIVNPVDIVTKNRHVMNDHDYCMYFGAVPYPAFLPAQRTKYSTYRTCRVRGAAARQPHNPERTNDGVMEQREGGREGGEERERERKIQAGSPGQDIGPKPS